MCGVAGIFVRKNAYLNLNNLESRVGAMINRQKHRGPDDQGVIVNTSNAGRIALGSVRLSVIDLRNIANMPMKDPSNGNIISYNGEIYNFQEIRTKLEQFGHTFQTYTDTEVILKAYAQWGIDCIARFTGMFAFCIWDATKEELILCRDRLGEKPLYFASPSPNIFIFASELRAILEAGLVKRKLDIVGLESYLFNGFVVSPNTLVEGVTSLLPGTYCTISNYSVKTERYYTLPFNAVSKTVDKNRVDQCRQTLMSSVENRLVSDVPLGAFLSGGLDSSAIVAMMAKRHSDVHTFSISFDEHQYDESSYSTHIASLFNTRHQDLRMKSGDFYRWLPDALNAFDQPSFDAINTYCVSRAAREAGIVVALAGNGADELFGGYPFFRQQRPITWIASFMSSAVIRSIGRFAASQQNKLKLSVSGLIKLLELSETDPNKFLHGTSVSAYQVSQMHQPFWLRQELMTDKISKGTIYGLPREFLRFITQDLNGALLNNVSTILAIRLFLGERILRDADTMSMAVSLELRLPFTDHSFIEALSAIPGPLRTKDAPNKAFEWSLLKHLFRDKFPYRDKQGFNLPFDLWMKNDVVQNTVMETLHDNSALRSSGLSYNAVHRLLDGFYRHNSVPWSRIWSLFILVNWCQTNRVQI